ncbi:hypothetical protein TZ01_06035 [Acidiplasma sp. MBA-1]|jgi:preprotein translocase subunit YajC|nr:hypothetical protein TZ01_06035 [Acidiplasma sp. MBA-1]
MDKNNLKYFIISVVASILLIVSGIFGVFYFILFINTNSLAYQITSFVMAVSGIYFLYTNLKRKKRQNYSSLGSFKRK